MRQLSARTPRPRRGVLAQRARLRPWATISWTWASPKPSSCQPAPVSARPWLSWPSLWMPLLSTQCAHNVGSSWSLVAARMRSPAASWTFTWRSLQPIRRTTSKLICISCPTPFSTLKVWSSSPCHHLVNSDHMRIADTTIMATVHFPPPDVRVTYWGFAFAVAG